MKKWIFLVLAGFAMASCSKTVNSSWIRGQVVYRSCATIAVQVKDTAYLHLGQNSWQQAAGKPVYSHVFGVANQCSFPANAQEGADILFKVIQQDKQECAICMLWDNPPTKHQWVKAKLAGD